MLRCFAIAFALLGFGLAAELRADEPQGAAKIRVVIIDGQNNHNWRATTPVMKKALEDSGRFTVDVSSHMKEGDKPGEVPTVPFPPDLSKYDVIVSNYNGQPWPEAFNKPFEAAVKDGKVGLVIVHAANNAFGKWNEYNLMIGMGWRGPKDGDRLTVDDEGKRVLQPKGEGQGAGHRYTGEFQVTLRDADHPVTKGMPKTWMHAKDELYDNMRGPIQNVHLLATAFSKGTKAHEPMIWTVSYGKGRVFHTPMGHDAAAMKCHGFIATLQRGTEWAATGKVTIPLPKEFPGEDKSSSIK
jgi:type 1 glutamine amidotransferase